MKTKDLKKSPEASSGGPLKPVGSAPRKVASAYWDEGWVLYDADGDLIEEWPPDWPKAVNGLWLEERGIEIL
jgi:hypothetical protein